MDFRVGASFAAKNLVLFLTMLIRFCDAQHLMCNITQALHGTLYTVPEFEATECSYSWMNSTGHVLANEMGRMDHLVFNSSIRTLLTGTCVVQLNYTRDCISEGIQHTAYCFTDCVTPAPLKTEETPRQYWCILFSVSVVVLALLGIFCRMFTRRNNPPRTENVEAEHL